MAMRFSLSLWERAGVRGFAQQAAFHLSKAAARISMRADSTRGRIECRVVLIAQTTTLLRKVRRDAPYGVMGIAYLRPASSWS